jgi:hypothetical protein
VAVSPGGRPMDSSPFSASTTSNWVARAGGLPEYVRGVAHALLRKGRARSEAQAIGMAIGLMQDWAAGRTPNGKGHVHPQVQAAAAAALAKWEAMKAAAHSHANEGGAVIALTWNGQSIDLGYMPPHVPAGSPKGGQFGTTSGKGASPGGTAGKTAAQQHADHMAHIAHLQHLVATGQATPAQKAELAGLLKALNAKPKGTLKPGTATATEAAAAAAIAAHPLPDAVKKKATAKPKPKPKVKAAGVKAPAAAKPVVDRKKGTVTATIGGKRVTMTLAQWHARHAAHLKAVAARARTARLANAGGRFLDLAITDALTVPAPEARRLIAPAERVPPGVREGGQFTPRPPQFTRYDTPERTAEVVNSMGPAQRARVRATILCPPGFQWQANDLLAVAR